MTAVDNHKSHYVHSIIKFDKRHKFNLVKLISAQKYYFSAGKLFQNQTMFIVGS